MTTTRKALVVDDNALNSKLVAVFLKRLGWQASVCDNGPGALELLRREAFDVVLLDLRMPTMTGEQVCRHVRDEIRLHDLPIVAFTAHGMPEERERMLAAGFNALLIKPISFHDVRDLCEQLAAGR